MLVAYDGEETALRIAVRVVHSDRSNAFRHRRQDGLVHKTSLRSRL